MRLKTIMVPVPLGAESELELGRLVGGEPTRRSMEYSDTKPELSGSGTDLRI